MWSVKCGVEIEKCGVLSVEWRGVECGVWSVEVKCGVGSVEWRVWSVKGGMCGV